MRKLGTFDTVFVDEDFANGAKLNFIDHKEEPLLTNSTHIWLDDLVTREVVASAVFLLDFLGPGAADRTQRFVLFDEVF